MYYNVWLDARVRFYKRPGNRWICRDLIDAELQNAFNKINYITEKPILYR
jgi:hypothetical protein